MNGGYIILSSTNSYDASNIMVTKIDNQLNFISNTVYKQTTLGYDRPSGIFESTNGEILISSVNQSTLSNVNSMRINFLKIASNGSVVWSKYYSGYSAFYSGGIIQHSSGDIYISGGVKIDSTSSSTTRNNQPILLKISNSGVLLNARLYRGSIVSDVTKNNGFRGLKELSNGTIALVGGSKTFTNQPSPQTRQDGFYLNVNQNLSINVFRNFNVQADHILTGIVQKFDTIYAQGAIKNASNSFDDIIYHRILINGSSIQSSKILGQTNKNEIVSSPTSFVIKPNSNSYLFGIGSIANENGISIKTNFINNITGYCFSGLDIPASQVNPINDERKSKITEGNITCVPQDLSLINSNTTLNYGVYCDPFTSKLFIDNGYSAKISINPNIFNNVGHFYINSQTELSQVNIDIYNLVGIKVKSLYNGSLNSGQTKISYDLSDLSVGVYFIRAQNGFVDEVKKIIVVD